MEFDEGLDKIRDTPAFLHLFTTGNKQEVKMSTVKKEKKKKVTENYGQFKKKNTFPKL